MMQQISQARLYAQEANDDVDDFGSGGELTFLVLLQLLRILFDKEDSAKLQRENDAVEETKFKSMEAAEFRDIFGTCLEQELEFLKEAGKWDSAEPPKSISKDGMVRFMRNMLGLKLNGQQRNDLH